MRVCTLNRWLLAVGICTALTVVAAGAAGKGTHHSGLVPDLFHNDPTSGLVPDLLQGLPLLGNSGSDHGHGHEGEAEDQDGDSPGHHSGWQHENPPPFDDHPDHGHGHEGEAEDQDGDSPGHHSGWGPSPHQPGPNPVPEPATILLLGSGIAGLIAYGRRRR